MSTNRKVESAQAGRVISARPGMMIGHMSYKHIGIQDMTEGLVDRPTFTYTFVARFPITFAAEFKQTFALR